jgi:plasmid stabilization system protein ParE
MNPALPVRLTALAARHIQEAERWWRINRTAAPNAVRQELERATTLIASQPHVGSKAPAVKLPGVRRIFLPLIKYHLYYHVVSSEYVEIIALWHSRRGDGPPV